MFGIIAAITDSEKFRPLVAIALLAVVLSACTAPSGGSSDDTVSRFLVAPGKYVLYSCPEIAVQAAATAARERELERLMAKADVDAGGRLVSAIAYRPEYLERRGEMNELRQAAVAKDCKFVPGADIPGGRASDNAIR